MLREQFTFWILFFNLSLVLVCLSPADPPV
uniref:Uncharacterized protein n=1 Tax=Anguilla anguilla TaxID=7936 RepID=A0A0E9RME9_ANGAN